MPRIPRFSPIYLLAAMFPPSYLGGRWLGTWCRGFPFASSRADFFLMVSCQLAAGLLIIHLIRVAPAEYRRFADWFAAKLDSVHPGPGEGSATSKPGPDA